MTKNNDSLKAKESENILEEGEFEAVDAIGNSSMNLVRKVEYEQEEEVAEDGERSLISEQNYVQEGEKNEEEDDDQIFISEQNSQDDIEQLYENVKEELKGTSQKLEGVRPQGNQQRNLARETGGLEVNYDKAQEHSEDAWDNRSEEVDKMGGEDVQEFLVDAASSSLRQSFIHTQKQKKRHEKRGEAAKDALESHSQRLQERRDKAAQDKGRGG